MKPEDGLLERDPVAEEFRARIESAQAPISAVVANGDGTYSFTPGMTGSLPVGDLHRVSKPQNLNRRARRAKAAKGRRG